MDMSDHGCIVPIWFQLVLIAVGAAFVAIFWMVAEAKRRKLFSGRMAVEFSDWYNRYYGPESGLAKEEVKLVIEVISRAIGVQATQLRPTDRLDRELSLPETTPLDETVYLLEQSLSEAFESSITIYPQWQTIDDVIRGIVASIR